MRPKRPFGSRGQNTHGESHWRIFPWRLFVPARLSAARAGPGPVCDRL